MFAHMRRSSCCMTSVGVYGDLNDSRHDFDASDACPHDNLERNNTVSFAKSTQGIDITTTIVGLTSGDRVPISSNNEVASSESESSLVKHRSPQRPALQFASPWSEN